MLKPVLLVGAVAALSACASAPARQAPDVGGAPLRAGLISADPSGVDFALSRPAYVALVVVSDADPRGPRVLYADGDGRAQSAGRHHVAPRARDRFTRIALVPGAKNSVVMVASVEPFSGGLARLHDGYLFTGAEGARALSAPGDVASAIRRELLDGAPDSVVAVDVAALDNRPAYATVISERDVERMHDAELARPPRGFLDCGSGGLQPATTLGGGCRASTIFLPASTPQQPVIPPASTPAPAPAATPATPTTVP